MNKCSSFSLNSNIANNICYGDRQGERSQIQAGALARIHDEILNFPNGSATSYQIWNQHQLEEMLS